MILEERERSFIEARRVARMASIDRDGMPHVLPICYALVNDKVVSVLDQKPKTVVGVKTRRIKNIINNPNVGIVFDHYDDESWSQLGWVGLRGFATVHFEGRFYDDALINLRSRYPQYKAMILEGQPLIVFQIQKVRSWGKI